MKKEKTIIAKKRVRKPVKEQSELKILKEIFEVEMEIKTLLDNIYHERRPDGQ